MLRAHTHTIHLVHTFSFHLSTEFLCGRAAGPYFLSRSLLAVRRCASINVVRADLWFLARMNSVNRENLALFICLRVNANILLNNNK